MISRPTRLAIAFSCVAAGSACLPTEADAPSPSRHTDVLTTTAQTLEAPGFDVSFDPWAGLLIIDFSANLKPPEVERAQFRLAHSALSQTDDSTVVHSLMDVGAYYCPEYAIERAADETWSLTDAAHSLRSECRSQLIDAMSGIPGPGTVVAVKWDPARPSRLTLQLSEGVPGLAAKLMCEPKWEIWCARSEEINCRTGFTLHFDGREHPLQFVGGAQLQSIGDATWPSAERVLPSYAGVWRLQEPLAGADAVTHIETSFATCL